MEGCGWLGRVCGPRCGAICMVFGVVDWLLAGSILLWNLGALGTGIVWMDGCCGDH